MDGKNINSHLVGNIDYCGTYGCILFQERSSG